MYVEKDLGPICLLLSKCIKFIRKRGQSKKWEKTVRPKLGAWTGKVCFLLLLFFKSVKKYSALVRLIQPNINKYLKLFALFSILKCRNFRCLTPFEVAFPDSLKLGEYRFDPLALEGIFWFTIWNLAHVTDAIEILVLNYIFVGVSDFADICNTLLVFELWLARKTPK